MLFRVAATISLVGGTLFLMWIGEQITSRGIGNGVSLIIMAGIVASLPQAHRRSCSRAAAPGTMDPLLVVAIVVADRRPGPVHLLHGAGAAPRPDPISQAPDRARHDAAGAQPPAAQAQHRRRHPADLRLLAAADAADRAADGGRRRDARQLVERLADHASAPTCSMARRSIWRSMRRASSSSASSTPRCSSIRKRRPRI